jgi:FtsZ-binding cell division protein ZapB
MNGLTGMEKFSHLEDKIYLTIEFVKKLKDEKERLERENSQLKQQLADAGSDSKSNGARLAELMSERETIQAKVEAMLDAITALDPEAAQVAGR